MTDSIILLRCGSCEEKLGNAIIDNNISAVTAEQVINFLSSNRVTFHCEQCSCKHSFEDYINDKED